MDGIVGLIKFFLLLSTLLFLTGIYCHKKQKMEARRLVTIILAWLICALMLLIPFTIIVKVGWIKI